jgi:hypothetical protein
MIPARRGEVAAGDWAAGTSGAELWGPLDAEDFGDAIGASPAALIQRAYAGCTSRPRSTCFVKYAPWACAVKLLFRCHLSAVS